jgi:hypothetical protein
MSTKDKARLLIAQEAARIIAEEGVNDYLPAKNKAAARLGIANSRSLPRNEEIDQALEEYHRLYRAETQPLHIARLRKLALEAMRFLEEFSPRLIGGALDGSASKYSPIILYVYPESPEEIIKKLVEARIPFKEGTFSLNLGHRRGMTYPALDFFVDGVRVELAVLPPELKGQRINRKEKTVPGGSLQDVEKLINGISP